MAYAPKMAKIPNRSLGLVVLRNFRRMNFVCLLMSDSELLRIKNKQKASYKSRKTARSDLKILIRPNDRFGIIIIAACEWKMCEIGAIVGGMSVKMSNFVV